MDKSLRNTLRNTVTHCRRLLEEAIAELLQGQFGIHLDGKIEDAASLSHLSEEDREYRAQILVHLAHIGAGVQRGGGAGVKKPSTSNPSTSLRAGLPTFQPSKETVAQLIREVAFTHLNRLAAYKMMETRGLIRESVSRGVKSQGFLFYLADHPEDEKLWSSGQQERAYRHFLTWLGGTLSQEIGVLFSPDDPANRLLPPQRVLDQVLDLLNSADLATIWTEDETIGWIYQYFTPKELRDQARSESQAPRNSYELAFRNQFYTPRYVVQFLTDNTLGRIWYEMTRGETRLAEVCQYLVRRPNEVFLREGEQGSRGAGEQGGEETNGEAASSEIVNRKSKIVNPVYIPFRAKKDPRDLKILDPASGSGHFLLYCFDLLELIYEEAYADPDLGPALLADYPTLAEFKQAIPALILRHNLHGIDIDPRAVQIASLVLWLRAKKSRGAEAQGSRGDSRFTFHVSRITKMNLVCAEPMPGNAALLDEFTADLQPPLLGQLLRAIVGKMELAGEAGSLLKIEEEIDDALAAAKKQWLAGPKPEQLSFFPQEKKPEQLSMFDLTGISDKQFWDEAEGRLLAALRDYAEHADPSLPPGGIEGGRLARRLFAGDTARGFAFIDLCRQRFDVVLMNPPFGSSPDRTYSLLKAEYPSAFIDILAAFVQRGVNLAPDGFVGAITSRSCLYTKTLFDWRKTCLIGNIVALVDLGGDVLDGALVNTCAYVLKRRDDSFSAFFDFRNINSKSDQLKTEILSLLHGQPNLNNTYLRKSQVFDDIPQSRILYWLPPEFWGVIKLPTRFEPHIGTVRSGLTTYDDERFLRLMWEVSIDNLGIARKWVPLSKGGYYETFYADIHLVLNWENNGREVGEHNKVLYGTDAQSRRGSSFYLQRALTYPRRTVRGFSARLLPQNCFFGDKGPAILSQSSFDVSYLLGVFNSNLFRALIHSQSSGGSFETGVLKQLPWANPSASIQTQISTLAEKVWQIKATWYAALEIDAGFSPWKPLERKSGITEIYRWFQTSIEEANSTIRTITDEISSTIENMFGLPAMNYDDFEIREDDHYLQQCEDLTFPSSNLHLLLSYILGVVVGRWDLRIAQDQSLVARSVGPLDNLPLYPPAMLIGPNGLPACSGGIVSEEWLRARPNAISLPPEGSVSRPTIPDSEYPLAVDWDGLLVDDPDHPDDLLRRVRAVLEVLWGDEAQGSRGAGEQGSEEANGESANDGTRITQHVTPEEIEREACEILGVRDLRAYFRNPGNGGFWQDHVKRYSKSRRKAPIYWLLQSSRKNYALWLYYHRLDKDIFYKALVNYVEPKIRLEKSRLEAVRGELSMVNGQLPMVNGSSTAVAGQRSAVGRGKSQKALEKDLDQQESFVAELHDFRDKLRRAANLNLEPDLNDGVVLNIAPLWELVPWKEARQYWEELLAGKYEWSSIGRQLREKGVVK